MLLSVKATLIKFFGGYTGIPPHLTFKWGHRKTLSYAIQPDYLADLREQACTIIQWFE